jgi:hypothetical protein
MTTTLQQIADYFAESTLYEFEQTILAGIREIKSLEEQLEWYRERVVWGHYEDVAPHYFQGKEGEHEINEPVTAKQVSNLYKALEVYERERARFRHSNPEITGSYFLSGGYGKKDDNLLPQFVTVCPSYGCAWDQVYEKTDRTITYEGS